MLLIVPYGIETTVSTSTTSCLSLLLIVPYGIETGAPGILCALALPFNCTLYLMELKPNVYYDVRNHLWSF